MVLKNLMESSIQVLEEHNQYEWKLIVVYDIIHYLNM